MSLLKELKMEMKVSKVALQLTLQIRHLSAYNGLKVKEVLALYRDITDDKSFDNILENDKGYYNFLLTGHTEKLAQDLSKIGNLLSRNKEIMTSEVRFTDRIFKFKHNYIDKMFNKTIDGSSSFDTLYFTLTGEYFGFLFFLHLIYWQELLQTPDTSLDHTFGTQKKRKKVSILYLLFRWWMDPEDLSVLVRRVGGSLEIRLVSGVEIVTFELLTSQKPPDSAEISCDGVDEVASVTDNEDGTYSIAVLPGIQCQLLLQL